jgi:hypothetical protein
LPLSLVSSPLPLLLPHAASVMTKPTDKMLRIDKPPLERISNDRKKEKQR